MIVQTNQYDMSYYQTPYYSEPGTTGTTLPVDSSDASGSTNPDRWTRLRTKFFLLCDRILDRVEAKFDQ